jgi:putative DNA primase/helicase
MRRAEKPAGPVRRILQLLENVRCCGSGWSSWCPAHDDHNSSLSVGEGGDGRALIFCHAGCDVADIVAALGLEVSDLFPDPRTKIPRKGAKHGSHC